MTIAFDALSTKSGGSGNFSWAHTPVGTPRGVIILIVQNGSGDEIATVTYGGVSVSRKDILSHTTGSEDGVLYAYFLGSGIPTGMNTVAVTVSGSSNRFAVCMTVTASTNTRVDTTSKLDSGGVVDPSVTLATGALANCFVCGALHTGEDDLADIAAGAGYTECYENQFLLASCSFIRRTANSTGGNVDMSWTVPSEEAGVLAVAIRELYHYEVVTEGMIELVTEGGASIILEGVNMTGVANGFLGESGSLTRMQRNIRSLSGGF